MTAEGTLGSESVWGKSKDTEVLRASPAACSGSIPGREQRMRNNRQKKMDKKYRFFWNIGGSFYETDLSYIYAWKKKDMCNCGGPDSHGYMKARG